MKFIDYWKAIEKNVFCIEEFVLGDGNSRRFVAIHTIFGIYEALEENDVYDNFFFYQADQYDQDVTYIDPEQKIEKTDSGIIVKDANGNKVELIFRSTNIIPHPEITLSDLFAKNIE